jgi:hypothetical protein
MHPEHKLTGQEEEEEEDWYSELSVYRKRSLYRPRKKFWMIQTGFSVKSNYNP